MVHWYIGQQTRAMPGPTAEALAMLNSRRISLRGVAMQCPKCGADNPDDAFFCGSCGVQLRSSFGAPPELPDAPPVAAAVPPADDAGGSNPFGEAEPQARQAYQHLMGEPQPQVTLSPQPLPTQYAPPPAPQYQPPAPPP